MGSSNPFIRTTKFPLPGLSLLISTVALLPIALWIFSARLLNAFHCLHASMTTTFSALVTLSTSGSCVLESLSPTDSSRVPSKAETMFFTTSSMSRAFKSGKGRFIPTSSTMGFFKPLT
uniref:Uncharacterized protein n=1 Tax=Proboscia inermis TaxID=420281 RepID=A0A7S0GGF0_9STRA